MINFLLKAVIARNELKGHDEPLWQTSADITLAQERDTRLPGYENGCFIFKSNTLGVDEIHL